jgi:hypothetical protein
VDCYKVVLWSVEKRGDLVLSFGDMDVRYNREGGQGVISVKPEGLGDDHENRAGSSRQFSSSALHLTNKTCGLEPHYTSLRSMHQNFTCTPELQIA